MNSDLAKVTLRPISIDDAAVILSYRSLPEVNTYTYTPVWTSMGDATAHVEKFVPMMNDPESGFGKWMVVRNDTGETVGDVFLDKDAELQGTTEIGYMIHPGHTGNGFATAAVLAAMRIGFEEWGVHRIYARVDEENIASAKVCQRVGMRQEARLIENDRRGDVWSNELIFALLEHEWRNLHAQPDLPDQHR